MPEEIKLTSEPLNKAAIRDIEKLAAAYERIAKAQKSLGTSGFTPAKGRTQELHDERMRGARARTQREELRTSALADRIGTPETRSAAKEKREWDKSVATERKKVDARQSRFKSIIDEMHANDRLSQKEWEKSFKGGGGGGGGGGGRGGAAGGRGRFPLRDRFRIPGTGLIANITGPEVVAAAALYAFVSSIHSSIEAVNELRRGALITGGTMRQMGEIVATGGTAAGAEKLRQLRGSDPYAIMESGFAPDPRIAPGSDDQDAAKYLADRQRLHNLRNRPSYQRFVARRLGMLEDLPDLNVSEPVFQQGLNVGRNAPTPEQAGAIADLEGRFRNLRNAYKNSMGSIIGDLLRGHPISAYKDSWKFLTTLGAPAAAAETPGKESPLDANTRAMEELTASMKQNQRDFFGRGVQDRGALPSALWGVDLMHGIRSGAIRQGAFR